MKRSASGAAALLIMFSGMAGFAGAQDSTTTTTSTMATTTTTEVLPAESVQDCVDPANPQGGFVPCENLTTTTTVERSAESTSTTRRDCGVAGTNPELPRTGVGSVLLAVLGVLAVAVGALLTRASHREVSAGKR